MSSDALCARVILDCNGSLLLGSVSSKPLVAHWGVAGRTGMVEAMPHKLNDRATQCTTSMPSVIPHSVETLRNAKTSLPSLKALLKSTRSLQRAVATFPPIVSYLLLPLGGLLVFQLFRVILHYILPIIMWPGWFYWLVFLSAVVLTWMFTRQAMENRHAEELRKYCTRYEYLRSMDAQWSTVAAGNSFEWINTIQRMLWSWHLEPELAEVGRYGSQLSCTRATNGGSFVVISGTVSAAVLRNYPLISINYLRKLVFHGASMHELLKSLKGNLSFLMDKSGDSTVEEFSLGTVPPRFTLGIMKQTRDDSDNRSDLDPTNGPSPAPSAPLHLSPGLPAASRRHQLPPYFAPPRAPHRPAGFWRLSWKLEPQTSPCIWWNLALAWPRSRATGLSHVALPVVRTCNPRGKPPIGHRTRGVKPQRSFGSPTLYTGASYGTWICPRNPHVAQRP
eukprot:1183746-Prorocentrum_minimum.AAC.1